MVTVWLFAHAPDTGATPWYWPLFMPAILGLVAVGGVHSGASEATMLIACGLANGLVWGCAVHVSMRIVQWLRNARSSSRTI